jgi:hypothetical protein
MVAIITRIPSPLPEPSVFSSAIEKRKNWNIQDYNFACGSVRGSNVVSDIKEGGRVFENRVLRRIFGPKRDEVTGEWRKFNKEELRDLYSSPSIITILKLKRMGWAGHLARMGVKRNAYRLLVGKPKGRSH